MLSKLIKHQWFNDSYVVIAYETVVIVYETRIFKNLKIIRKKDLKLEKS